MMRGPAGMGGGNMLRAVGRAVGASVGGLQEAVSTAAAAGSRHGKPARLVSVTASSPASPASSCAASAAEGGGWQHPHPCFCDGDGWVPVGSEDVEEAAEYEFAEHLVFGPVPSTEEVVEAVSTIQHTMFVPVTFSEEIEDQSSSTMEKYINDKTVITNSMHRVSSSESESDWIEPAFQLCSSNNFQSPAREKVIGAFHLLQMNPSIKRTVISLSSDKAVWDAVMKNEAVQELRKSFYAAEIGRTPDADEEDHNISSRILRIFQSTKTRIMELVERISKIVGEIFSLPEKDKKMDLFDDALRSSLMLSVVVFIVVIISRGIDKAP